MDKYIYNEAEAKLLEQSAIPYAIYQYVNKQVVTVLVSQGFLDLSGITSQEEAIRQMDKNMYWNVHPDDVAKIEEAAIRFAEGYEEYNVIYRLKMRGEYRLIHSFGKHLYPEKGVKLALVWYVDEGAYVGDDCLNEEKITGNYSISLREDSLNRKTKYDYLTGLPNMSYFFEMANENKPALIEGASHFALGFANINGMKYFNKKYGFSEGDVLLRKVAGILARHFGNDRCCRMGQDNFAFLAYTEGLEQNLSDVFKELEAISGEKNISIRIGIHPDTMGMVEVSLACDRARYACNTLRNSTSSCFAYFNEDMLSYENNRQYVIDNLDKAIEENWICAYYQPIVRAANGRVCDEEALARWIDPEKGMMSPAEFIPILEDAKLIYKVDLHMVDLVIEKMKRQSEWGLYIVPISVNLSRTDFDACDMVEEIRRRVDEAGINRNLITIEITESVVGTDFDFIKEQVERFQNLGFHVWMDDFGSGYSSLDVLQSLHFDLIKLDMSFLHQFDTNSKTRIIITEFVRMAMGLGMETVAEGVETAEQVEFLREIGCTKLQGFYFCKPIAPDQILERNKKGIQIGFENPDESEYYEALGRINLYDTGNVAGDESEGSIVDSSGYETNALEQYFDTLPMAIMESDDKTFKLIRCNQSYREFLDMAFGVQNIGVSIPYDNLIDGTGGPFVLSLRRCAVQGGRLFVDERLNKDTYTHTLLRRIAVNPVTGFAACAIVILGIVKDSGQGVKYADIATTLSSDYLSLYYVNLKTDEYIEYHPDSINENLNVERRGKDFFETCIRYAERAVYADDLDQFKLLFSKDKVIKQIEEYGKFSISYRYKVHEVPIYVQMKAILMSNDSSHLIVGVTNVDAQVRQQETLERMQEEHITYSRISAISGDYIFIYTVDPDTGEYTQYIATEEYEKLGLPKAGDKFFEHVGLYGKENIHPDDVDQFLKTFTKENIMRELDEKGVFISYYRMMIEGKAVYVSLRAALVEEKDGPKLIVGICNIDAQVRRDKGYKDSQ